MTTLLNRKTLLTIISLIISANIAFFLYQWQQWPQGYWSVISIAAVATADMHKTLDKMVARIVGTLFGALYAYTAVTLLANHPVLLGILLMLGISLSSIIALQKNIIAYAGIVGSITIVVIFVSGMMNHDFYTIAVERTYQVCLGIIISGLVGTLIYNCSDKAQSSQLFLTRLQEHYSAYKNIRIDHSIYEAIAKIILASVITFLPWLYWGYPGGFWATISCFFIIEESFAGTRRKALNRFIANLMAGLFGLLAVLIIGQHVLLLALPLTIGLAVCGYILAQEKNYSTIGNTMGIAICIILLTEPGAANTTAIIISRFLNVMFGVMVGILISAIPFGRWFMRINKQ